MDYISTLLWLPDNMAGWQAEPVDFQVQSGRLDNSAPNLARPCFITTGDQHSLINAKEEFQELLKRAVPIGDVLKQEKGEGFKT
jgi:hypothetical protein